MNTWTAVGSSPSQFIGDFSIDCGSSDTSKASSDCREICTKIVDSDILVGEILLRDDEPKKRPQMAQVVTRLEIAPRVI